MHINGQIYTKDLIILPDRILSGWWRQQGHVLHPTDLEAVFEAKPKQLIVGQGAHGRMKIPKETERELEDARIELIASSTDKAVERYNDTLEQQSIAAAFHLTC
jgi:hypothetical protein